MSKYILKSDSVDIIFLAEGTYPYILGGVSSWIHQLISSLPEFTFGIVFLGSKAEDYGEVLYKLPPNLLHLEVHYIFDEKEERPSIKKGNKKAFESIREFHKELNTHNPKLPDAMKDIKFFEKKLTKKDFLYSKESWEYISQMYQKNCPDIPFIDYFWTVRNMHAPIWKIAKIVKNMPKCKALHSPSTGYAGFLGFLASNHFDLPFLLTEHGIYTKERKIDLLSAKWISSQKASILKDEPEEFSYTKQLWVNFFEKIGKLSYSQAKYIISLYPGARDIQLSYGADKEKCLVIPNGVDMKRLNALVQKRDSKVPKVVTLIGRVVSIKDIKTFIRAIKIAKMTIPDIKGWIVGPKDEEKEYASECFNMVKLFDLEENIEFLGFRKIDEILPKTGLLTLTSISEGMPLVILEGFAAGVPCVATDVGSCKDLIYGALDEEDKKISYAGAITSIANPSALAKHYVEFLSDEVLWKRAQKSALKRVEIYYQEHLFLDKYRSIYSEMM